MSVRKAKIALFLSMLTLNMSMTGISSFYPLAAEEKGYPVWLIGLVFSAAPLSSFIFSFQVPKLLEKFGRRSIILAGTTLVVVSKATLSTMILVPLPFSICLSFLGRVLFGTSYSMVFITIYTTLTSEFPEEATKMITISETMSGIGVSIGPTFGAMVFVFGGYIFACLSFAFINILVVLVLALLMRNMRKYEIENVGRISLLQLLSKPKITLDFMLQVLAMFSLVYLYPILDIYLGKFNLNSAVIGLFYSITPFCYMISSIIVTCLPANWTKPRIMMFGVCLLVIGFLMSGPNHFIFPDSLFILALGLSLIGFAGGFMYILTMPHMLEVSEINYGYSRDDMLSDSLSGLTSASLCLGEVLGPSTASALYDVFGYETSANFAAIVALVVAIVYGIFSDAFRRRSSKVNEFFTKPLNYSLLG